MMGTTEFLWGMSAAAAWVAGVCFFRFWRETRDRLFAFFGAAFWVLGGSYVVLALLAITDEALPYAYLIRLVAFIIILAAIVDKNRAPER
ncbi:MAG: hypothetical protein HYZ58_14775 [Acidobacteria bacterium]|nr:hypothetical protein [Acidobacteriota bacterium]